MSTTGSTRGSVLHAPVDGLSQTEIVNTLIGWTTGDRTRVAVGVNANVCNLAHRDELFRERLRTADLCYADGQSVVWAARALGTPVPERVATTDLVFPLAARCALEGKRLFLFGAAPGVAERAAERLKEHAPGLHVATSDGYVATDSTDELISRIRSHRTDVLLVGLGDPLQQAWIADHREHLGVPVILSCGGLFDWTAGSRKRAPRWMIGGGLEWLWRLILEPRRLGRRYLVGNPLFVVRFAGAFFRHRLSGRQ